MLYRIALAVGLLFSFPAQAQYLKAPAGKISTQAEDLYAPKPLTKKAEIPQSAHVTARGETVYFRPGLAGLEQMPDGSIHAITERNQRFSVWIDNKGAVRFAPLPADSQITLPARDVIPHAQPGTGQRDIQDAWLIQPTTRYINGVLGDTIEAAAMRITLRDGRMIIQRAEGPSVYEDLQPRIADANGDGREDILVVRSTADQGASLVIYTIARNSQNRPMLQQIGATPTMNQPKAWLNPVGVGDFDGDGRPEIAMIERPYDLGTLSIWRLEQGQMRKISSTGGFSNHKMGVPYINFSLVRDINGDEITDMVIPAFDRKSLRLISFRNGTFTEIANLPLKAPIKTNMIWVKNGILMGLENDMILHLGFGN